ncbi:hypothetical protein DEA98_07330 [Brucella pseudogrignonensis]|nr:hypothetical protein [Brucella pseudogrignonensis]
MLFSFQKHFFFRLSSITIWPLRQAYSKPFPIILDSVSREWWFADQNREIADVIRAEKGASQRP